MTNRTFPRTDRGWATLAVGAIGAVVIAGAIIAAIALHSSPPPVRYTDQTAQFQAGCQARHPGAAKNLNHPAGSMVYDELIRGNDGVLWTCQASLPGPHAHTLVFITGSLGKL